MNRAKGTSTYFLLDHILVDAMLRDAIVLTRDILRPGIERFLGVRQIEIQPLVIQVTLTCLGAEATLR